PGGALLASFPRDGGSLDSRAQDTPAWAQSAATAGASPWETGPEAREAMAGRDRLHAGAQREGLPADHPQTAHRGVRAGRALRALALSLRADEPPSVRVHGGGRAADLPSLRPGERDRAAPERRRGHAHADGRLPGELHTPGVRSPRAQPQVLARDAGPASRGHALGVEALSQGLRLRRGKRRPQRAPAHPPTGERAPLRAHPPARARPSPDLDARADRHQSATLCARSTPSGLVEAALDPPRSSGEADLPAR